MEFHDRIVLVVDDEEAYRILYQQVITTSLKAKFREADNPKAAFEMMKDFIPDLILLDMQMPVMDGLTALNIIRSQEKLKDIAVIASTALNQPHIVQLIAEKGISDYIVKPFHTQQAAEKIARVLASLPPKKQQGDSGVAAISAEPQGVEDSLDEH
ncbi:MAG: response regulator [Candidatus Kapabacteria bacterium]|nr:response regulator [Candidatus Kapabacteria bacterium]